MDKLLIHQISDEIKQVENENKLLKSYYSKNLVFTAYMFIELKFNIKLKQPEDKEIIHQIVELVDNQVYIKNKYDISFNHNDITHCDVDINSFEELKELLNKCYKEHLDWKKSDKKQNYE